MIPYSSFYYFYFMILALIPAVILGLFEKKIKWYGFLASIFMLYMTFSPTLRELVFLCSYIVFELLIIVLFWNIIKKKKNKAILWIGVFLALSPLIFSKLSNLKILTAFGFIGISYLTFKIIQVLIQSYDNSIQSLSILDLLNFIVFFPTLGAGPIDRSARFLGDANRILSRQEYLNNLGDGIFKILKGVLYKFVLAYCLNFYILSKIPLHSSAFIENIKYMYTYSMYLFFDFAGYSLIAIGTSYILGIKTPENFNLPFLSRDIKEFWNRWHMSLSFWFRDFIYNRFVMAALKKKWFKSKYTASHIGFLITMATMGLWHGFQLHYIVYGLFHGIFIVVTDIYQRTAFYKNNKNKTAFKLASTFVTFNLVCFSFFIFSGYLFI